MGVLEYLNYDLVVGTVHIEQEIILNLECHRAFWPSNVAGAGNGQNHRENLKQKLSLTPSGTNLKKIVYLKCQNLVLTMF